MAAKFAAGQGTHHEAHRQSERLRPSNSLLKRASEREHNTESAQWQSADRMYKKSANAPAPMPLQRDQVTSPQGLNQYSVCTPSWQTSWQKSP
jgi:hypothetical protein